MLPLLSLLSTQYLPQSFYYSFQLLFSFVQSSITDDNRNDFTPDEIEEELFDVTVKLVIITTKAVIETRTRPVESEPEVIAVDYNLAAS